MSLRPFLPFALVTTGLLLCGPAIGASLYTADFSVPGQGSTHTTSTDPLESSPVAGANWTLTFGSPSTDTTTNEFITTAGGVMRVQDWGGDGTITSALITISGGGLIDITGSALTIGTDSFNDVGTEGITWFYILNGDTTSVLLGETELGGPVAAGTDVGHSFTSIAVADGDELRVGFTVNVNGAGDGVEISSLVVIPEPTTALLASLGLLALFRRRRAK